MAGTYRSLQDLSLLCIRGYQTWISPALPRRCRFYPSCSAYLQEAIEKKGLLRGLIAGCFRLLRCHPLHPGGMDPVQ